MTEPASLQGSIPTPEHPVRFQVRRAGRSPGLRISGLGPVVPQPSQHLPVDLSYLFRSRSRGRLCLTA